MGILSNGGRKTWAGTQRYKQPCEFSISSCWVGILCFFSQRKVLQYGEIYPIQNAANILKLAFLPNHLSRVMLPQVKARKESSF